MFSFVKVQGESMEPCLSDGDFVLISRWILNLKVGNFVVFTHPKYARLIKKIKAIDAAGNLLLQGCNPTSLSPEKMGWIKRADLEGKVIFQVRA